MKKIAVIAVAGALSLGACSVGTFDGSTINKANEGEVRKMVVTYKGRPLTCLDFNPGFNNESIVCDFTEYYNSTPTP
jgi:hypothetical protein